MPAKTLHLPPLGPEAWRRTVRAREEFVSAPDEFLGSSRVSWVRPDILSSWRRSWSSGVDSYRNDVARTEGRAAPSRLLRAARPVLDRLAERLAGTSTCVYLTDRHAHILQRIVDDRRFAAALDRLAVAPGTMLSEETAGTNGLGTVVEQQGPVVVAGAEHYREDYQAYTCAGVPLRHPITNRFEGVLDITCRYQDTNRILLPLVAEAARAIEEELLGEASAEERAVFEEFVKAKHRYGPQAVISLNEDTFITNAVAAQLLEGADHDLIWGRAKEVGCVGREVSTELHLSRNIPVTARFIPVQSGAPSAGVIVIITPRLVRHESAGGAEVPSASSSAWQRVLDLVGRTVDSDLPMLIRGEPGTGKTFVARLLHERRRRGGGLSELDCLLAFCDPRSWLADLRAKLAVESGTVVLRHIDELPIELAGLVGSLLEATPRGRRVVATAGARPLQPAPLMRLQERLVLAIDLPPLRDRVEHIPELIRDLTPQLRKEPPYPRFTQAAVRALMCSDWPGNVSQLRQAVVAAATSALSADVTPEDLPAQYRFKGGRRQPIGLERVERETIAAVLRSTKWNREQAARQLDISRTTLWRKMKKFGIGEPALRPDRATGAQGPSENTE